MERYLQSASETIDVADEDTVPRPEEPLPDMVECGKCRKQVDKNRCQQVNGKRAKKPTYKCNACNRKAVADSKVTGKGSSLHEAWKALSEDDQEEFMKHFGDDTPASMKKNLNTFIMKKSVPSRGPAFGIMLSTTL